MRLVAVNDGVELGGTTRPRLQTPPPPNLGKYSGPTMITPVSGMKM